MVTRGSVCKLCGRLGRHILAMLEVAPDHFVAVTAVAGKDDEQQEVRRQQRPIEKIEAMHSGESIIEERLY